MTCARAAKWLQLYVDGRLDVRHLARLEEHVQECPTCRDDLLLLEIVCQASSALAPTSEPIDLTEAIMLRVAELERRRAAATQPRVFTPVWADALLAGIMATIATATFLIFQPGLRLMLVSMMAQTLVSLERGAATDLSGLAPWVAWVVWVGIGVALTLWLAGSEVRNGWRRNLMARLPR
ncbi:MAG TPA: zf-HC2 domain-containing protein [Ktedonobacterales bacterium]